MLRKILLVCILFCCHYIIAKDSLFVESPDSFKFEFKSNNIEIYNDNKQLIGTLDIELKITGNETLIRFEDFIGEIWGTFIVKDCRINMIEGPDFNGKPTIYFVREYLCHNNVIIAFYESKTDKNSKMVVVYWYNKGLRYSFYNE